MVKGSVGGDFTSAWAATGTLRHESFTGRSITKVIIMATTVMHITHDPAVIIDIVSLTLVLTTEIVPSGSPILAIVQATTVPIMVEDSNVLNFPRLRSG
jgi:hypothetical protein